MKSFLLASVVMVFAVLSVSVEGYLRGRFIHLTDTHNFLSYGKGTDPKHFCIEGKSNGTAGEFGDYNCDPPPSVYNFTIESLKHREKPDFILYGGDHEAIFDQNASMEETVRCIKEISQGLREIRAAYGSDVRVFPMIGNHDSFPYSQFPEKGPYYVYETAAEAWKDFLQPQSLKTLRAGGYYTELIKPGLRIVVVNTVPYFICNVLFPPTLVDPGGQLAWLRDVLQSAKDAGEYVFIAAHIPPGITFSVQSELWNSYNDQYVRAFEGFNGNPVVAGFYGHHHWATYRIITNENVSTVTNDNSHVAFVSSSITPERDVNPVFTEYTFMTKAPYNIIDRSYEYIDLKKANSKGSLEWTKAKSYRELFGLQTLDAESMNDVIIRMRKDNALFRAYYQDLRCHSPAGDTECFTEGCKNIALCGMNYTLLDDVQKCIDRYK